MKDIYNLSWIEVVGEDECEMCVCPHCHSDRCNIFNNGSTYCENCHRENGKIKRHNDFDCPHCNWHLMEFDSKGGRWECQRCHYIWRGDKQRGPTGEAEAPLSCPTCGTGAVKLYNNGNGYEYYECLHCRMLFDADKYGRLVPPEHCPACGHMSAQAALECTFPDFVKVRILKCRICKQRYDLETKEKLNWKLEPVIEEDTDALGDFSVKVAKEVDYKLNPLGE